MCQKDRTAESPWCMKGHERAQIEAHPFSHSYGKKPPSPIPCSNGLELTFHWVVSSLKWIMIWSSFDSKGQQSMNEWMNELIDCQLIASKGRELFVFFFILSDSYPQRMGRGILSVFLCEFDFDGNVKAYVISMPSLAMQYLSNILEEDIYVLICIYESQLDDTHWIYYPFSKKRNVEKWKHMHYIFVLTNVNKLTVSILPHQLSSPIIIIIYFF